MLTPRFYTTDFEEMEQMFSLELNPNLNMEELEVNVEPRSRLGYRRALLLHIRPAAPLSPQPVLTPAV